MHPKEQKDTKKNNRVTRPSGRVWTFMSLKTLESFNSFNSNFTRNLQNRSSPSATSRTLRRVLTRLGTERLVIGQELRILEKKLY